MTPYVSLQSILGYMPKVGAVSKACHANNMRCTRICSMHDAGVCMLWMLAKSCAEVYALPAHYAYLHDAGLCNSNVHASYMPPM